MELLNKEQIFTAKDKPYKDVEIKEWGGVVRISTMSIVDREEIEMIATSEDRDLSRRNLRLRFLIASIVDEKGDLMFTLDDMESLQYRSAKVVDKLFAISQALNGITDEDVDELAKN